MKKTLLLIFTLCATFSFGQSVRLAEADDFYNLIAYASAAEIYTELIGSEVDSPTMRAKLADCYYQMGETDKAEEHYQGMIQSIEATPKDVYQYAQALKENGKYSLSDQWMDKYATIEASDSRAIQYKENKGYLDAIINQEAYFSVNHLSMNTKNVEFGGYPLGNDKICFISDRRVRFAIKRIHTWNDRNYLDFFVGTKSEGNDLTEISMTARKDNSKYHEGPLCLTPDGNTVYFTRNNISKGDQRRDEEGIQNLKLYVADIDQENGSWMNVRETSLNSRDYSVGHPTISADGKTLFFASDRPGGFGGADVYKCSISADGTLGEPENLGSDVNTEGQDMFPWVTKDGILFYSSDGNVGLGGLDVFAMIPNKAGEFTKKINLGEPVNSSKDDFALVMLDEKNGYLSSNRTSGSGNDDIYSVLLLRELKVNLTLNGVITDVRSGEILPGAEVELVNEAGEVIASTTADDKGGYTFGLEPEFDYTVKAANEDYFPNQGSVSTKNLPKGTEEIEKDVALEKDPGLSLYALITDAKTSQPLDSVIVTVIDNMTGEKIQIMTDEKGDYLRPLTDKKLDDRGSYNFSLSREGYIPKVVTYNTLFDREGQYDVHSELDLTLDPMVTDLAQLIEINPINFDLNKAIIRPDAKVELDKIVEIMNKYPNMEVELGSHTDCRASRAYNEKLSDRRAKASAAYIKTKITNPERIYGKGYGESRLLNDCECEGSVKSDCTEDEHEQNRRTEFKVISVGDPNVGVQNNSTNSFDPE
jgi:outer membrane protein OmpA-like peptidoglycan-associated protein/tetratricopeptide (TPR) repeat protein